MITNSYSLLGVGGTVQAAAADIVVNNHILSITGCPNMDYRKIEGTTGFLASVAETLGVVTYTPIAANSTEYTIVIQQYVPSLGTLVTRNLTHVTPSAGATATTICDALRAQLLLATGIEVVGSGTTTLVLTAVTGSPVFTVVNNTPTTSTVVVTTPGVVSRGTTADLTLAGITGWSAGQVYSQIAIDWISVGGETNGMPNYSKQRHTLYVNAAATNFAAFSTRMGEVVNDYAAGTTDANPESSAIG